MMTRAFVVGSGSMGSAIGQIISRNVEEVWMWDRRSDVVESIKAKGSNELFFPGFRLASNITATSDLSMISESDYVFLAVPSHAIREVSKGIRRYLNAQKTIISLAKGLEYPPLKRMSQVVSEEVGSAIPVVALSGPNFADELIKGEYSGTTIACENSHAVAAVLSLLCGGSLMVESSSDIVGVEMSGVLKNAYSIALGICDALSVGRNSFYFILGQSIREMSVIIDLCGGDSNSLFLSSGISDLCLTANSDRSRNRTIGLAYGRQMPPQNDQMGAVQEGKKVLLAIKEMCERSGKDCPVLGLAYSVVWESMDPKIAYDHYWKRRLR